MTGRYNDAMNHKRGFPAFIAAFVFIFFFEFVWHGMLMKSLYMETASLWREEPMFPWLILGQAVIAFAFSGLYVSMSAKSVLTARPLAQAMDLLSGFCARAATSSGSPCNR